MKKLVLFLSLLFVASFGFAADNFKVNNSLELYSSGSESILYLAKDFNNDEVGSFTIYYGQDKNGNLADILISDEISESAVNMYKEAVLKALNTDDCTINCNRREGCYDKPSDWGVALCLADCILECTLKWIDEIVEGVKGDIERLKDYLIDSPTAK